MAGLQRSEEQATRNGIGALEVAFTGVQNCRRDVENMKHNLSSGYAGHDGGQYQNLLQAWDDQAEIISKNLNDVITTLNETLREHGLQQGSAKDDIDRQYQESQAVFNALTG